MLKSPRVGLTAATSVLVAVLCMLVVAAPASAASSWEKAMRQAAQNFQRQIAASKPKPKPTTPAAAPVAAPAPAAPAPAAPAPGAGSATALDQAKPGDEVALAAGTTLVVGDISRAGSTTTVQDSMLQIGDIVVGTGVEGKTNGSRLTITEGSFTAPPTLTDQRFEVAPGDPLVYSLPESGAGAQVSGGLVSTGQQASTGAARIFAAATAEEQIAQALPPAPAGKSFRFTLKLNGDLSTTVRAFIGDDEVVYGRLQLNGAYEFSLSLPIEINGTKIFVGGTIKGSNILNPASISGIKGQFDIAVEDKARVSGSLEITGSTLAIKGSLRVACPVSGDIGGAIETELPLRSSNDWSVAISGGAGPDGCAITKDFGLGPNSGVSGKVESVDGKLEIDLKADATVNTTLIPTKTSFSVGFGLNITRGAYRVTASGSTQGAGFSADIQSNGSYTLAFHLDDLKLGGVSLGAKGFIKRTAPSAAVEYSISGSLAGKAEIYPNLFILGGSVGIDSKGGLTFGGSIRQLCNSGYLDASAKGEIKDAKNFSLSAVGLSSQCRIGRGARFDGRTFFADINSTNGKVLYNAGVSVSRLDLFTAPVLIIGEVTTWLTDVTGSISNDCSGCYERGVTQLKFSGRANASYQSVSKVTKTVRKVSRVCNWLPWPLGKLCKDVVSWVTEVVDVVTTTNVAATGYGTVEVNGLVVKKITIGVRNPQFGLLTFPVQAALTSRIEIDLERAFTT